jgi:hypothetical protein
MILEYEDKLHDLRKYGFSFITGLLSVDALFAVVAGSYKLAALLGTLCLIVLLDFIDRNYRILEQAASLRAQIIERRTRMNLTQTIDRMYVGARVRFVYQTVYIIFIYVALLVGWIIFGTTSSFHYWSLLTFSVMVAGAVWVFLWPERRQSAVQYLLGVVVDVIAILVILEVRWKGNVWYLYQDVMGAVQRDSALTLHYHLFLLITVVIAMSSIFIIETRVNMSEWVDFEIDDFDYVVGDEVLAMITNCGSKDVKLIDDNNKVNDPALTVHPENDPSKSEECSGLKTEVKRQLFILPKKRVGWSDYRWLFSTESLSPGLYRAVYNGPVYMRTRTFHKLELLDPRKSGDKEKLRKLGYESWFNNAQRFRVHKNERIETAKEKEGDKTTL